jgi:CRISPR-associated endonuclease/helicase Cas3
MATHRAFAAFFKQATGQTPFPYQSRLAESPEWPARIEVPTGLGKTLAVVVGWLWRRQKQSGVRDETPRRLVYCLPMRVLVEQSRDVVAEVIDRLGLKTKVIVLMGGVDDDGEWDTSPEDDTIIIGTQDMLLSRALNRGYGMSRYRWPLHFGLLNTDCLWVIDEVQLVGSGVATTAQLQALRRKLGTLLPAKTSWMSATLEDDWLRTVDVEDADLSGHLALDKEDRADETVAARIGARKACAPAKAAMGELAPLAKEIATAHQPGTRTLVIVNTVDRARELHAQLDKLTLKLKPKPRPSLVLLHSRFRLADRQDALTRALAEPADEGTIVVSTQVIEAGVDLSSATLFTELAPWSSLVQRFGRCNRRGELKGAKVFWVGLPAKRGTLDRPYTFEALDDSAATLAELEQVGPKALPKRKLSLERGLVLRRRDLLDLFDTTPDLMGNDVDVSRFIRDTDEHDLRVCWRSFDEQPSDAQPTPRREELCAVPIGVARDWHKAKREMWVWDGLEGQWSPVERLFPGLTVLLRAEDGGYDPKTGLDPKSKNPVEPIVLAPTAMTATATTAAQEANDADPLSQWDRWYGLTEHCSDVAAEAAALARALQLPGPLAEEVHTAARWHDLGKAHDVWQDAAKALGTNPPAQLVAKSQSAKGRITYARRGFRHELASALAALRHGQSDLVAYLVASHHGKVRMSLRSAPTEPPPMRDGKPDPTIRFARGVWEDDRLPAVDLGGGVVVPETTLTLSYMELGQDSTTGDSWAARVLALRDRPELGPFRLGFLEALVKCADERVSRRASEVGVKP